MRHLILIKHSQPAIDPHIPAKQWCLSTEGRQRCTALVRRLSSYDLGHIITSMEPKASETAQLLAAGLNLSWYIADNLHEHDRSDEPFRTAEQFQQLVATFFTHANELIFGKETAHEALMRFAAAVERVMNAHPKGNIAIVAHGTVMSLFVAAHNQITSYELWQRLTMPSFVVLALPHFALVETVASTD